MPINRPMIKNALLVRNDRFGEFLLNIPAFRAIKQSYPNAKLTLVVNTSVQELAQCVEVIDGVIIWENRRHKFSEILKFSREVKNKKFDLCIIFNPSKEFNIISFLSGIPMRLGYNRKWGFLLTHKMKDKKYLGQKHEVEANLDLVSLIGVNTEDKALSLKIDDNIIDNLIKSLGLEKSDNLVALHPWTSDPIKQWPLENFSELARRIAAEQKVKVLIVGGKGEGQISKELFGGFNDKVIDVTGKTTLRQLAALLKKCRLLISGDSGPMHLASAVGTPVIAIFRNDLPGKSPRRWGPWGNGHLVIEENNLSDIGVDKVFHKAKERLEN